MVKTLVVEGWRRSSHSYALVNQHQLIHLCRDPRLRVSHVDVPFYNPEWTKVEAGLSPQARRLIDSIPEPASPSADVVYRISYPLRVHGGNAHRTVVFGTSERQWLTPAECCGPSGTPADVDRDAVEIITPSNWSRVGFLASGFDERKVHVLPHGVDTAVFSSATVEEKRRIRASLQIPEDAHVFLNVGAMTWNKGIGVLLAAFMAHRERDEKAVLLLKGSDQLYGNLMRPWFAEATRNSGGAIADHVLRSIRYSGNNLALEEVARLHRASDFYVSPYRAEGFNLPVLEAIASGVLPIVTRGGSTEDFCPDHLSLKIDAHPTAAKDGGRYLEPDINSLITCMERAVTDQGLRERVAIEGPRWVAEHYSWAQIARSLADRLAA